MASHELLVRASVTRPRAGDELSFLLRWALRGPVHPLLHRQGTRGSGNDEGPARRPALTRGSSVQLELGGGSSCHSLSSISRLRRFRKIAKNAAKAATKAPRMNHFFFPAMCRLLSPPWAWVDLNHRPHPYQGCALTA